MLPSTILLCLAMAVGSLGAPFSSGIENRAVVSYDSLNPVQTRLQGGAVGRVIEMFTPTLHIAYSCQPYTAVDDAGNTRYAISLFPRKLDD